MDFFNESGQLIQDRKNKKKQMLKKQLLILSLLAAMSTGLSARPDTVQHTAAKNALTFSGFVEAYYGYDLGQPKDNRRPAFVYSYDRHNEVNINLGYIKATYAAERVRGNLALATGTYMNANYAAEPGVLKNIYEANVGVKLSKTRNIWLDAGVISSHIGFENAHSHVCWTLTRSIIADNSPYYESGATLGYTSAGGKWFIELLALNGWQRIQRVAGNSAACGGTQVSYTPSAKLSLNYSTFFGNDYPDSIRRTRIFHNLYGVVQATARLGLLAGIDYGMEQKFTGSSSWNNWLGAALIIRYKTTGKTAVALRGEYYLDEQGVIVSIATPNSFKMSGISLNFDYSIMNNVLWRIEGKMYNSGDAIFTDKAGSAKNLNAVATTSLSIAL